MSGIDDIVEMILKEARLRKVPNVKQKILSVHSDVWGALVDILDIIRLEERRKKGDGNRD